MSLRPFESPDLPASLTATHEILSHPVLDVEAKLREENESMKKRLVELEARDKAREERLSRLEQFMAGGSKTSATIQDAPPAK